jgi:hypothetical protein
MPSKCYRLANLEDDLFIVFLPGFQKGRDIKAS